MSELNERIAAIRAAGVCVEEIGSRCLFPEGILVRIGEPAPRIFFLPSPHILKRIRACRISRAPRNILEILVMTGEMTLREMKESDRDAVMQIFNHYAAAGFAAYPDGPLPPQFFTLLLEGSLSAVVLEGEDGIAGFGLLKPFLPFPVFRKTGMLTYFLAPEFTGRGLGSRVLEGLAGDAKKQGITMLVVNMSSKNEASIRFHKRRGFSEAGHLAGVGEKFGGPFGIIWMQRAVE